MREGEDTIANHQRQKQPSPPKREACVRINLSGNASLALLGASDEITASPGVNALIPLNLDTTVSVPVVAGTGISTNDAEGLKLLGHESEEVHVHQGSDVQIARDLLVALLDNEEVEAIMFVLDPS